MEMGWGDRGVLLWGWLFHHALSVLSLLSFFLCSLLHFFALKLPFPIPNKSSKLDSCLRLPCKLALDRSKLCERG